MRIAFVMMAALAAGAGLWAKDAKDAKDKPTRRYLIEVNLEAFPQDHPKTALYSVIKAIEAGKIDYLLAQLADPKFVDLRVQLYDGNFEELVKETTRHLTNDPTLLKDLKRHVKDGEWETEGNNASVFLQENKDRRVFLRKVAGRWYLENEQTKKKKSEE
jgi:hypothetical protein